MKKSLIAVLLLTVLVLIFAGCAKPVEFELSFVVDGETYETVSTAGSEIIAIPQNPEKEGYTFEGWYWDEGAWSRPFTASSLLNEPLSSDMSVHARFDAIEYTIAYEDEGGIHSNPTSYTVEDGFVLSDPERAGYTFTGWYTDDDHSERVTRISKGTTGNITLYAAYEINTYTISYENTKGAENGNPATYDVETDTITLLDLSKPGYTFDGWYSGSNEVTRIDKGSVGNLTLTARWSAIDYEIIYHGTEGAINPNPSSYDVEDEPLVLADADKAGYIFRGWYTDASLENAASEITSGTTGELDLYAKWEIITYTATFKDGDTLVGTAEFTVESEAISEPEVPNHKGYNGSWESYTIVADNITVNAVYTPIVYTITYEGTKGVANSNPTTYTIESATITLADISATGYTFIGWYNGSNKVTEIAQGSTGNITLTADWSAIRYDITYMYDAEIGDYADVNKNPATYTIEDDFDFIALVNKTTGYTFDGWYTEKNVGTGTKVTGIEAGTIGNITVYAHWALDEYTITYHNADNITNTNATTYTIETDTFTVYDVAKAGYSFLGWYSDSTFGTRVTEIAKGTTGNLDLYAQWTPVEYTIEYVLYGGTYSSGSNPSSYTVKDEISLVSPTLNGYTFVGFFTLAEGGERVTEIREGTTGNKTLYARYIAFDTNGGSAVEYDFSVSGNKISEPTEPEMEYYTFVGWYTDEALTEEFDFSIPTKTLTLYAKFEPTVYKITYVLNGGTNPQNQVLEYTVADTTVTLLDPTKTGYTFVGWFTDESFTSSVVTELKNEHGDKTFYANYSINQYTISFETNGGTEVEAITQNYATSVAAPSAPAKNGYKFAGWYSDSALKKEYTFTTIPAEDITLYAKWTLETYDITYNLEGGTNNKNNPSTFNIQSADITLQAPTKTGYSFAGWYTDNKYENAITKIATGTYGNVELYAKWDIITYTITYVTTDGTENTNATTYTVATDFTSLADAILKGHTFNGWYKENAYTTRVYQIGGGEVGNITLYAKFTANTYDVWLDGREDASVKVSFDLNGASGSVASQTITEANTLTYPTAPTRAGYVFGGWYQDKECAGELYDFTALITGDITLYAKWVEAESSIAVNSNVTVTLNGREEQKFTFVPLVSGNVTFTTTGSYDTLGILYDANGNVLKMDDDTGSGGVNFQIVFNVTAGEVYTIAVRSYSSSTNGRATLYVSGDEEAIAGGYVIAGNKAEVTFGSDFTLPVPDARDGYKFLGWSDESKIMYTDGTGKSIKAWDKDETTLLVSVWERTVYTITFNTGSGTKIDDVTLAFGERIDISKYVSTRSGYKLDCWILDGTEFNATTMPDRNITLIAKWTKLTLGEIKIDEAKTAISVNDKITAELFGVECYDSNGNKADIAITVNGTQASGETLTITFVASAEGVTAKYQLDWTVKVYGAPTLEFNSNVDYVNLVGGMTAEHFGASGVDSFGNATEIRVYIEGEYKAGDTVTVIIASVDPAGNETLGYVCGVKAYGLPEITYNKDKTAISVSDTVSTTLFGVSGAVDSFGKPLTVTVSRYSGTVSAGNTVTIRISATDEKGNVRNIDVPCKVYGTPTISSASRTDVSVSDDITPELLGITAKDTFGNALAVTLSVKDGTQKAGETMTVTATVTDAAGNIAEKSFTLSVYGAPEVSYDRNGVKLNEAVTAGSLNAKAYDSFGGTLSVSVSLKAGNVSKVGTYVVYTLTATDKLGNSYSIDTEALGVYDIADIEESFVYSPYDSDFVRVESDGSEFSASATDSFGNACTITVEAADGKALVGGTHVAIVLVATDKAGNRVVSEKIDNFGAGIAIYAMPTVEIEEWLTTDTVISSMAKVYDSFGKKLYAEITWTGTQKVGEYVYVTVKAIDNAENELNAEFEYIVHREERHDYADGFCSVCGKETPYTRVDDDTILFGSYPQAEVTDTAITDALVALAGTKPTSSNAYNWTSYGYYISGSISNYMWYIDLDYGTERYRGVYFTSYRPYYPGNSSSTGNTYQDDNGYYTGTVYWFRYEPISWTILKESGGTALILCDMIIDSQQFDYENGSYSNDYAQSTVRKWLNEVFYNTAFNDLEKEIILTTTVDNSVASTGYSSNPYACEDTEDKVFLLSYKEVTTYLTTTAARQTTDYAQSQGAYTNTSSSYAGNGYWWLRSPNFGYSYSARLVVSDGYLDDYISVYNSRSGVVPALQIQL